MEFAEIREGVDFIKSRIDIEPEVGIILGSGLGDMAEDVEEKVIIKYSEVPGLPQSTVKGHAGQFVVGKLNGKNVIMMQGRFHYYEGNKIQDLAKPVYMMKYLGVKNLIVTNAAGGVNTSFKPGDLMLIKDHINFAGTNPLIGKNDEELGPRFPDMSKVYDESLRGIVKKAAEELNLKVQEGTYFMFSGPTYETPAEIRMVRVLGGDAVGMSTVPEAIAASHCGLKVIGISCITNMAAGILDQPLNHMEVIETSSRVKDQFIALVSKTLAKI